MKNILNNLDKVLESRIRLGIMSILVVNEGIDFNALKDFLEITDGNLASHLTVLEKNEYILITKRFFGKKPNTSYQATEKGTAAFKQHLDNLETLIKNHK